MFMLEITHRHSSQTMSQVTKVNTRASRIDLRVTQKQKDLLARAASLQGLSLSAYTLSSVLPIAQQEADSHESLVLSDRDRDLFMSGMENPPKLKGKLKAAMEKYRAKYEQE
jgi:uncharacterized protein (DUF1778 family)